MEIQRMVQFPAINLLRPLKSLSHRTEKSAVCGQENTQGVSQRLLVLAILEK